MKKVQSQDINSYMMREFGIVREEIFFTQYSKSRRNAMINKVFEHKSGYRMWRGRLQSKKNTKDVFDNYRSFNHIKSYADLAKDIEVTKKKSKDVISRAQRKLHRVRKERFQARKRKRIKAISEKEHLQKWSPRNKQTKQRLAKLKSLKEQEKGREFER